jgi:hypothetical protein
MLSADQKNVLEEKGYLIIPKKIDDNLIISAQKSFSTIKKKAKKGMYPYIRVYDNYCLSNNLAGIEMTYHKDILDQQIFDFIQKTKIIDYAKSILGDDIELDLSRYHLTENFSHVGIWHRDEKINHDNESIQINVFLYDETGLQIIEKSHKQFAEEEIEIKKNPYTTLNSSKWINTKAGEVLIFDPAVLHRAISEKSRANIHFRFKKRSTDKIKSDLFNDYSLVISKEWRDVLDNSPKVFDETMFKKYEKDNGLKSIFLIFCRRMIYNFIFFLPLKSKLYKIFDVRPNLYLRRIFNISS